MTMVIKKLSIISHDAQPNMFLVNAITFEWLKIQKDDFFINHLSYWSLEQLKLCLKEKCLLKCLRGLFHLGKCFIKIASFWNPLQFYIDGFFLIFLFFYIQYVPAVHMMISVDRMRQKMKFLIRQECMSTCNPMF